MVGLLRGYTPITRHSSWLDRPPFICFGRRHACELKGLHIIRDAIRQLSTEKKIAFDEESIYHTARQIDIDCESEHETTILTVASFRAKEDLAKAEFEKPDRMRLKSRSRNDEI